MTSSIRAVLFDLDGTLVNHEAAADQALTRALATIADPVPVDRQHVHRRWRELEHVAMNRYLAGELTFADQRRVRATTLAAELGLGRWNHAQADAWFAGYLRHYEAAWCAYDDVRPTIDALVAHRPGLTLGVLTNGDADQQYRKLLRTGLADRFTEIIASSEVGTAKPDPRIFRHAGQRLRLPPAEIVYVGDRLDTDANAAVTAGMRGVWLNRDGDESTTDAPMIRTLHDLPTLLAHITE